MTMQGTSRQSLAAARESLETLVRAGDSDLLRLGDELFAVASLLDRESSLRRALTDPARTGDDRAELARGILGGQVSPATADVIAWVVRSRWSAPRELADAVELLGAEALVASAETAGRLDAVEDELFRTSRVIAGSDELRAALSDQTAPVQRRVELAEGLLAGKVADETLRLVRRAVVAPRGRGLDRTLETFADVAADRRSRLVAVVTAAVPLTEEQRERLARALARTYGHEVHLNVEVDPSLVGGVRVEIGDEVIDGTVLSRLHEARRRLAG